MSHCQSHSWGFRWMPKDGRLRDAPKNMDAKELQNWVHDSVCKNCGTTGEQWNAIGAFGYKHGNTGQEREWFWSTRFALGDEAARPPTRPNLCHICQKPIDSDLFNTTDIDGHTHPICMECFA